MDEAGARAEVATGVAAAAAEGIAEARVVSTGMMDVIGPPATASAAAAAEFVETGVTVAVAALDPPPPPPPPPTPPNMLDPTDRAVPSTPSRVAMSAALGWGGTPPLEEEEGTVGIVGVGMLAAPVLPVPPNWNGCSCSAS